jgi:hypothetical protein
MPASYLYADTSSSYKNVPAGNDGIPDGNSFSLSMPTLDLPLEAKSNISLRNLQLLCHCERSDQVTVCSVIIAYSW